MLLFIIKNWVFALNMGSCLLGVMDYVLAFSIMFDSQNDSPFLIILSGFLNLCLVSDLVIVIPCQASQCCLLEASYMFGVYGEGWTSVAHLLILNVWVEAMRGLLVFSFCSCLHFLRNYNPDMRKSSEVFISLLI